MKRAAPNAFDFAIGCRCGVENCGTHEATNYDYDKVELPSSITPMAYELDLTLRLEDHEFDGFVRIAIDIKDEDLDSITLHSKDLKFHEVELEPSLAARSISLNAAESTATFTFPRSLPAGQAHLRIKYSGELNDKMDGFYRSTYINRHGEQKTMASTFFCATTARKALPCWDEPLRKATFQCSLRIPAHMIALSNMPELASPEVEEAADATLGTKCVRFERTPRMSSYLLAFVVSEMDCLSAHSASGVLCRVFTPPGKAASAQWALDHAVLALDRFTELFGVAYPLPKADLVALPEFAMGAMENWGLVTYRETKLLLPEGASPAQRQGVAETVIHEAAHQWFGNLVTMAWWDDIWLNEGFATWMETHVCDSAHTDWQKWDQFVASTQGGALARDALRSSHPIQVPMQRAEQVDECFVSAPAFNPPPGPFCTAGRTCPSWPCRIANPLRFTCCGRFALP